MCFSEVSCSLFDLIVVQTSACHCYDSQAGDVRKWKRYRLVLARKEKLHLTQKVLASLEANTKTLAVTTSGFFPCSIAREYLYGYATDGYRSPLWFCAGFNGSPALVAGTGSFSTLVSTTGNWSCYLAYTTLMPTDSSRTGDYARLSHGAADQSCGY